MEHTHPCMHAHQPPKQKPHTTAGKTRAKRTDGMKGALCLQIHGDAAMSGQVRTTRVHRILDACVRWWYERGCVCVSAASILVLPPPPLYPRVACNPSPALALSLFVV